MPDFLSLDADSIAEHLKWSGSYWHHVRIAELLASALRTIERLESDLEACRTMNASLASEVCSLRVSLLEFSSRLADHLRGED